jgi:putative transposase
MTAMRSEQHIIKKSHQIWKTVDKYCFRAKNLYNYANYIIRQEFINNGKWIRYGELDKLCQQSNCYYELGSQAAQNTLTLLDKNWKSFFRAIKDWSKHKEKYLGKPKLPNYRPKDGRSILCLKISNVQLKMEYSAYLLNRLKVTVFPQKLQVN